MSLSVIIPDETKMTIPKFEEFGKVLTKFISSNIKDNQKEIEKAIKKISEISGYLIAADKKKFPQYFTKFDEFGFLNIFNSLLDLDISDISFCILEAINFLLLNLKNKDLILTIYKTYFKTKIQGQEMNILDKLMGINFFPRFKGNIINVIFEDNTGKIKLNIAAPNDTEKKDLLVIFYIKMQIYGLENEIKIYELKDYLFLFNSRKIYLDEKASILDYGLK